MKQLISLALILLSGCVAATPTSSLGADNSQPSYYSASPNSAGAFEKVFGLGVGGTLNAINPVVSVAARSRKHLTIFHFNDLHTYITVPDRNKGATHFLSQMVKMVSHERSRSGEHDIVLFFSAGDDHIGTLLDELVGYNPDSFVLDPAYSVYGPAGIDAAALGNHEFDRGTNMLAKAIVESSKIPLLSANIGGSKFLRAGKHYHRAIIGIVKGIRVGVIGLTTRQDVHDLSNEDPYFTVENPLTAARSLVPLVASNSDVVIILSHNGIDSPHHSVRGEGDREIAKIAAQMTTKPILVVGGHSHTALNVKELEPDNIVDGVPIVQAGERGKYLGQVTADLIMTGNQWKMMDVGARLIALKNRDRRVSRDDPRYAGLEQVDDYEVEFEKKHIAPLFERLNERLTSELATVSENQEITPENTIKDRYTGECALGNFMTDAIVERSAHFPGGKIDVAVLNASGIETGVPIGRKISFSDWYAVMPWADTIQIAMLTGRQLRDIVRNNAKRVVLPVELSSSSPVDLSGYVSRGYLHFSRAVRYTILAGDTAAHTRAVEITVRGQDIDKALDQTFRVAFNSYVGTGAYSEAWNGQEIGAGITSNVLGYDVSAIPKRDTGLIYRNEIIEYIRTHARITRETGAKKDGRVKLVRAAKP